MVTPLAVLKLINLRRAANSSSTQAKKGAHLKCQPPEATCTSETGIGLQINMVSGRTVVKHILGMMSVLT